MTREILFRGKSVANGEWIVGNYTAPLPSNWGATIEDAINFPNLIHIVNPKTVGQYTGLTDKNGKRIFEGDIVDCWSEGVNAKGTVQQRKDGLWIIYPAWQNIIMWGLCPDEFCHTTVEVIGNIHDNPELIAKEEEQC